MEILLTNDDGIHADGIKYLRLSLAKIANVITAAPEKEQSATGHGITMHKPLRIRKYQMGQDENCYSVSGTPADCVKISLETIMDQKPDYIFSGINNGYNLGIDVLYSGTVSAAIEGAIDGYTSIAVSITEDPKVEDYVYAAEFIKNLIENRQINKFPRGSLFNINIPPITKGPIKGVKFTFQGLKRYENNIHQRVDPRGRDYYWLSGDLIKSNLVEGSDLEAIEKGYISITPLIFNLTNNDLLHELRNASMDFKL